MNVTPFSAVNRIGASEGVSSGASSGDTAQILTDMANAEVRRQLEERVRASMVGTNVGAEVFHIGSPISQLIRDLWLERDKGAFVQEPVVRIIRMFQAHSGIEHFKVDWNNNPLLLFADMYAKEYAQVWTYQQAGRMLQWASKKAILCYFTSNMKDSCFRPYS